MSGQEHTAECRKRLEDVMTTDASASTRVKATPVRQAERITSNSNDPGVANQQFEWLWSTQTRSFRRPGAPGPVTERDTEMRSGSQEAPETRQRPAETDAERLEEEATSAQADSERRLALKRKAEGDLDDSGDQEVEDSVMNSLAKLWHRENDPDNEVDLLILQQRDCYTASMRETGGDKPVCEESRHLSLMMNADGITSMIQAGSCLTTHLSRRRELKRFLSSESLVSGRW